MTSTRTSSVLGLHAVALPMAPRTARMETLTSASLLSTLSSRAGFALTFVTAIQTVGLGV